ncbi:MAG: ATP-binding cassette domain-containing protein [Janthinobacterium lividum]
MSLFSITGAHLAFGHVALLDATDFSIESGERVGLIGRNGAGKSSLLKIVAGLIPPDDGLIARQQGVRTVYVPQEPVFDEDVTIFEAVSEGLARERALLDEYERVSAGLSPEASEGDAGAPVASHDSLMARLGSLQAALEATDAWQWENRVATTLDRLGLDGGAHVKSLSGGQRKRVALARALVAKPDVLLLDEPTNHLDFEGIRWLETLLIALRTSVFFITHDRTFLDRVATRIVELDRGRLLSYPGNFSAYQRAKALQLEVERVENAKFDKLLAQEEVWIRQGVEARRTRSVARIQRLQSMRNERVARRGQESNVRLDVAQGEKSGKIVAELIDVSKRFGARTIVDNFTCTVMRGDKIGLIGPNGAGKTTLIRLILGELKADAGRIRNGANLQVAYFDQMREQLNENHSLIDTISPGSEWIEINGARKHVMSYLGDFLFSPERARSPVSSLSGGERNRLLLARLFARPANVLVLDEPTNDLDIPTLELLEELLTDFDGTVLLVSHDRAFLDQVVTSVIAAEGAGRWREYVGGFSDWQLQSERAATMAADAVAGDAAGGTVTKGRGAAGGGRTALSTPASQQPAGQPASAGSASAGATQAARPAPTPSPAPAQAKLSFKEKRELEGLPERIAALEAEQRQIAARLEDGSIFVSDPAEGARIAERFATLDAELLGVLERWEALEARSNG